MTGIKTIFSLTILLISLTFFAKAQPSENHSLNLKEQSIIKISALTAQGELGRLETELNTGLDNGLSINEIKEILVHTYAYCGFPRSIRGLQTFMKIMDDRKSEGIADHPGKEASEIKSDERKYLRGKRILGELTQTVQPETLSGYGAFAPIMDTFLKEHLFADIFERDILTFTERELVTISVISAIGHAEPMLRSHMTICIKQGITPEQLHHFVAIIRSLLGDKKADSAANILNEIIE